MTTLDTATDPVEVTVSMLNFSGVQASIIPTSNGKVDANGNLYPEQKAVIVFVPALTLHLFDGSKSNEAACMRFIQNLAFPFQELQGHIKAERISGFAILPEADYANEVWANQRTQLIGQTLQSIAAGEIDPTR